jgi:hypothetical protein
MASMKGRPHKTDPKWKVIEHVAALIEKTLDPGADVQLNQFLPELKSGGKRQCDVTVRTGPAARRTLSIVEVQRRHRRVDVAMLDGWIGKMEAVGAQHLVAVSTRGFQKGAIARAQERGPTVRLCTLQDLEAERWSALGLNRAWTFVAHDIGNYTRVGLHSDGPPVTGRLENDDPRFTDPDGRSVSLNDIVRRAVMSHDGPVRKPGDHTFKISIEGPFLFRLDESSSSRVAVIEVDGVDSIRHESVPIELAEYTQMGEGAARTWVMTAKVTNKKEQIVHVTFRPAADGRLTPDMSAVSFSGFDPDDAFTLRFGNDRLDVWSERVRPGR